MSFGKLYTYPKAPRSTMVLFIAKYNKLDVEICNAFPIKVYPEKGGVGDVYLSKFHTGKVPALETSDGFEVYESNAVAWFQILKEREEGCELTIRAIEKEIKGKKHLVGNTLTLADLFVISGLARGYQYVFTKSWAEKHPVVHEYYMSIRNDKDGIFDSILGPNIIRDEAGGTYPDYDRL
ncbi:hypothetical protein K4K60_001071 [Colletotrichum sp. SAR11_57]|nr:hypothetical protein K4K60_001071 [Colletotrichum sp. SAR11_57]